MRTSKKVSLGQISWQLKTADLVRSEHLAMDIGISDISAISDMSDISDIISDIWGISSDISDILAYRIYHVYPQLHHPIHGLRKALIRFFWGWPDSKRLGACFFAVPSG